MQNLINTLERLWLSYLLRWLYSLFYWLNNRTLSWNYRRRLYSYMTNWSRYCLPHDFWLVRLYFEWLSMRYWLCFILYFLVSKFETFHYRLCVSSSCTDNLSYRLLINDWSMLNLSIEVFIVWSINPNIFRYFIRWIFMLVFFFFNLLKIIFVLFIFSRFFFWFLPLRQRLS